MKISLSLTVPVPSSPLKTVAELLRHIQDAARLEATIPDPIHTGSSEPSIDRRDALWARTDEGGRPVGLFVWSSIHARWIRHGAVGELLTIVRTASTVALDMEGKGLAGPWKLANGDAAGIPSLADNGAFFSGTGPDWDIYTVAYSG